MANFKRPKTCMAITALAGPVSNLLLAAFIALVYGLVYTPLFESGAAGAVIIQMILTAVYLSCALAVFNIIPIPPLDGSNILFSLLPDNAYNKLMRFERFGFILLLILIYADVLSPFLSTARRLSTRHDGLAQWS